MTNDTPRPGRGKHGNQPKGADHYNWSTKKLLSTEGYVLIRVGTSHPLSDKLGLAYEHRLVYAAAFGPAALNGIELHHINRWKMDNRLENLLPLTLDDHAQLHLNQKGNSP